MNDERKYSKSQSAQIADSVNELQHFVRSFHMYEATDSSDPFQKVVIDRTTKINPEFKPGGDFYDRFIELSLAEDRNIDNYFDLGVDVGGDIIHNSKNDRDKILYFMNAYLSMNLIQSAIIKHNDIDKESVHHRASQVVATTVLDTVEDYDKFSRIIFSVMSLIEELDDRYKGKPYGKQTTAYFNALVILLGMSTNKLIEQGHVWQGIISKYETGEMDPVADAETERMSSLLTREAMSHRKYGTKPAYIEASIGGAWVFYDGEHFKEQTGHSTDISSSIAAVVMHTAADKLDNLSLEKDPHEFTDGALAHMSVAAEKHDFMIYITHDGDITTDQLGLNSFNYTFANNISAASRLKAEVVSNFYDLSMPVYKKASIPTNYPNLTPQQKEEFDPVQQLLIPRVRLVGKMPKEAGQDISRSVREHDVTWFVRLLPDGFRASPDAVTEAARHGIILEENETFVKTHKRGNRPERILGYHAVKR